MKFSKLVDLVSKRTGYPRSEAAAICHEFIEVTAEVLGMGKDVTLPGIGFFWWKRSPGGAYVHVVTKERVKYPPGRKLRFKPCEDLRRRR